MGESVWVLGASMTKISRYPDKDVIDLAAEATFNALDDAGVSIFDIQVLAAGSMFNMGGIGQQVQKQIGQTGIPVYNVVERVRHRRHRGAHRVWSRSRPARPTSVSPSAPSRWARWASSPATRRGAAPRRSSSPRAATAACMPVEGLLGTGTMPAVFAQAGMEYAYENDGVGFEQFAKVGAEEPRALGAEPAGAVPEGVHARGDHGRRDDRVPEHAADVLPHRRRCRGDRARVGAQAEDAVARAAEAGGEGQRLGADHRPVERGRPGRSPTSTPSPATPPTRPTSWPASVRRTSTWSSCTTASPPPSSSTTTTCGCASPAAPASSSTAAPRGATAPRRSTCRAVCSRRATRSARPASPTSSRSPRTCGARRATVRSRAPRWAWPTSSASARRAASTSSRRPRS